MSEKPQFSAKDERYRSHQHSKEEKKRQKREWKKRVRKERKRKKHEAKRGTLAVIDMPNVRQNQIDGTGNDDLECGDFLNMKLKCNTEWLEVEGASTVKKKKNGFVGYKGCPQEQVSIEKTKHPETITYEASQGLSRGQKMLALVKLKRPDISAHNPKMFSKTIARTVKFTTSHQLEKQPSSTSKSVREINPLVNCQNFSRTSWVWNIWTVFPGTVSKYYSSC